MWDLVDVCVLTVTDMTNSSDTYGFDVSFSADGYRYDVRTGLMWALVDVWRLQIWPTVVIRTGFMWALVDVCVLTVTDMTNSSDTYGFDVSFSWCLCADGYRYDQQ